MIPMEWASDKDSAGIVLIAGFFILYGLEFVIPLIRRKSSHLLANLAFAVVLSVVNLLFATTTVAFGDWIDGIGFGFFNMVSLSTGWVIICSIIFLDFWAGYLVHWLFHKYQWLWYLHSIHHSDDLVDVTTTFRQHPIESMIRIMFQLTGMALLGIPVWVLMIYLTLSTIHSQLEHANIRIPRRLDRFLQYIIVTPNMHKVHHSRYQQETDSNYSNIFSVWDRLLFTYKSLPNYGSIDYGLDYLESGRHYSFWDLIKLPFVRRSQWKQEEK